MGTRAHFCTPNPSGRVDSSTQSTWLVAWQTPPGSLSIISTPSLKLGVLLGHSSLSPAPASVCGAGGCAPGAMRIWGCSEALSALSKWNLAYKGPTEAGNWLPPASTHGCSYSPLAWAWGAHCSVIARRPGPAEMGAGRRSTDGLWRLGHANLNIR